MEKTPRYTGGGTRDPRNPLTKDEKRTEQQAKHDDDGDDDGSSPEAP